MSNNWQDLNKNSIILINLPNFSSEYRNSFIYKVKHYNLNFRSELNAKTILEEYLIHRRTFYVVTTDT